VYNGVIGVLEHNDLEPEIKCQLLQSAMDTLGKHSRESTSLELGGFVEIHDLVSDVRESNKKLVQQFLERFTNREPKTLYFH
jgi:hypothetical protein